MVLLLLTVTKFLKPVCIYRPKIEAPEPTIDPEAWPGCKRDKSMCRELIGCVWEKQCIGSKRRRPSQLKRTFLSFSQDAETHFCAPSSNIFNFYPVFLFHFTWRSFTFRKSMFLRTVWLHHRRILWLVPAFHRAARCCSPWQKYSNPRDIFMATRLLPNGKYFFHKCHKYFNTFYPDIFSRFRSSGIASKRKFAQCFTAEQEFVMTYSPAAHLF